MPDVLPHDDAVAGLTHAQLADGLFCSPLQPSDEPDRFAVATAIGAALATCGGCGGCLDQVAQECGDHPSTYATRMAWCCRVVRDVWPEKAATP